MILLSSVETGVNYAPMEAGSGVKFTLRARSSVGEVMTVLKNDRSAGAPARARSSVGAIMTVLKNDRRSGHKKSPMP